MSAAQNGATTKPQNLGNDSGFTLIELLVVIGIIGILASLVLSALSQAKASARAVKCQSNEHQLGLALRMYIDEFGVYPRQDVNQQGETPTVGDIIPTASFWLEKYLGVSGTNYVAVRFYCAWRRKGWVVGGCFGNGGDYQYNDLAGELKPHTPYLGLGRNYQMPAPVRESAVVVPSETIAFFEPVLIPTETSFPEHPQFLADYPYPRKGDEVYKHRTAENMLYCDGHLERMTKKRVATQSDEVRRQWFTDNLPHRELWP